jgi:hypothetical protein
MPTEAAVLHWYFFFRKAAKGFCLIFIRRIKKKASKNYRITTKPTLATERPLKETMQTSPKGEKKREKLTLLLLLISLYI